MSEISRRGFMVGCSAAIAAMAGGRLGYVAFGSPLQEPTQEILIVIFLRGGMDGLSAVMPIAGDDRGYYESNRVNLAIPTSGNNAALPLNSFFGLHPAGAPLHGLYQDKKLAIIHAAGLVSDTRSHFDAMKYMELGTPGSKSATNGWLTRYLQSAPNLPSDVIMPALSVGSLSPTSLAGSTESIGMTSASGFSFGGNWRYSSSQRQICIRGRVGSIRRGYRRSMQLMSLSLAIPAPMHLRMVPLTPTTALDGTCKPWLK